MALCRVWPIAGSGSRGDAPRGARTRVRGVGWGRGDKGLAASGRMGRHWLALEGVELVGVMP